MVLYILADLISFLENQRLQLAGSSSTVFAVNSILYSFKFELEGRGPVGCWWALIRGWERKKALSIFSSGSCSSVLIKITWVQEPIKWAPGGFYFNLTFSQHLYLLTRLARCASGASLNFVLHGLKNRF